MNTNNKIMSYSERHPFVTMVLFALLFLAFLSFIQKDKEIETVKHYLTNTENGDFFTSPCEDYFNKNKELEVIKYNSQKICSDLTRVVNEANKNAIEVMYVTDRENYERYRQSKE